MQVEESGEEFFPGNNPLKWVRIGRRKTRKQRFEWMRRQRLKCSFGQFSRISGPIKLDAVLE